MLKQIDFYETNKFNDIIYLEGDYYAQMRLRNEPERTNYFLYLLEKNNCIIQRYYWRSLYDENHIEYIEPKIYDAFYMVVDTISKSKLTLESVMDEYNKNKVRRGYLGKLNRTKLTEEDIKRYATSLIKIKGR